MDPKTLLLEQKHLLNEIDFYIYSTFLGDEEMQNLLNIFKCREANLENVLNRIQTKKGCASKKIFLEYVNFRKKLSQKENEFFEKVLKISAPEEQLLTEAE